MSRPSITAVLFDYGGVLAEEGFEQGLQAIARANGLDPEEFFETATRIIYECGYVTGRADEHHYWELVRERTGITGSDQELTQEILSRFVLRPEMMAAVERLRQAGLLACILSDQTDWLDRLERRDRFFHRFDRVFNSYHLGKTKRDPSHFTDVLRVLDLAPQEVLFVDDNLGHVQRARQLGIIAHHFKNVPEFLAAARTLGLEPGGAA